MNYDKHIADAANEYVSARTENALMRSEKTRLNESRAYDKLIWMVSASKLNWDPAEYEPEF